MHSGAGRFTHANPENRLTCPALPASLSESRMNVDHQLPVRRQQRRLRRTLAVAVIAAGLCLGTTACGNTLLGGADADVTPAGKPNQRAKAKPTVKSVKAFYARASNAYRTGNARQLCRMMQPDYAAAMVEEAAASGLDVSTCREMWQFVFECDPEGYKDKISKVAVKGRTATFLSGDDPWHLRFVHGQWLIVDQN